MNGQAYVLAASILVWVIIFGYLAFLQFKYRKLNDKVQALSKKTIRSPGRITRGRYISTRLLFQQMSGGVQALITKDPD